MTAMRTALTQLQSRKGDRVPYLLTAAVGAGPTGYTYLNIPQMDAAMDFWNLMVSLGASYRCSSRDLLTSFDAFRLTITLVPG